MQSLEEIFKEIISSGIQIDYVDYSEEASGITIEISDALNDSCIILVPLEGVTKTLRKDTLEVSFTDVYQTRSGPAGVNFLMGDQVMCTMLHSREVL